jgi:beta-glucosidase
MPFVPARLPYVFPRPFVWGVATAAPQIEGAAAADGRGESIWDRFAAQPGCVRGGDTPAVACDHYHRFRADFALMQRLGVRHYRLSLSWPRLHPDGNGAVNAKGLDFYRRLLDALHARGITPWVTLYHWDLPQALEDRGGWRVRSTAEAFARYCETAVRGLGDRVQHWMTLNEIPTFIGHGYRAGVHAPGAKEPAEVVAQCFHHALLAHGHAVRAVREHGTSQAHVGLAQDLSVPIPVTETAADIAAAEKELAQRNAHILAPVCLGRYAERELRLARRPLPRIERGDLALISTPTDFLGLNIYSGDFVRALGRTRREVVPFPPQYPIAGLDWLRLAPQSIYWALRHCHSLYAPKNLYITENGAGYDEPAEARGEIADLHRRDYLRNHLLHVHRAVAEGIPCRGYFAWSFLDNFEWAEGYAKRFGLVHVNFRTQRRTPKLSASWYAQVMKENRIV